MMNNSDNINVENIMKQIKEEASNKQKGNAASDSSVVNDIHVQSGFAKKLDYKKWPFFSGFQIKEQYVVDDFLQYPDEVFIHNIFKAFFGREPYINELDMYLTQLRTMTLGKLEIIWNLYHACGKTVIVTDLKKRIYKNKVIKLFTKKIPVIRYFIRIIWAIVRLPKIERYIQEIDTKTNAAIVNVLKNDIKSTFLEVYNDFSSVVQSVRNMKLSVTDQQRALSAFLDNTKKNLPGQYTVEQVESLLKEEEHLLDALYVSFEDTFRGSREKIKENQKQYITFVKNANVGTADTPVLDIGCGRGEWLELLKENSLIAKGLDRNKIMVKECLENNFDVIESDALEYLSKIDEQSLGAITGFHIVEHLPLQSLIRLLDESLRVLKTGGVIIFETPNPENLIIGSCNFYLDPTHKNPVPPDLLRFLAESRGFVNVQIIRSSKMAFTNYNKNDELQAIADRFNTEMEYAIIGYKP